MNFEIFIIIAIIILVSQIPSLLFSFEWAEYKYFNISHRDFIRNDRAMFIFEWTRGIRMFMILFFLIIDIPPILVEKVIAILIILAMQPLMLMSSLGFMHLKYSGSSKSSSNTRLVRITNSYGVAAIVTVMYFVLVVIICKPM